MHALHPSVPVVLVGVLTLTKIISDSAMALSISVEKNKFLWIDNVENNNKEWRNNGKKRGILLDTGHAKEVAKFFKMIQSTHQYAPDFIQKHKNTYFPRTDLTRSSSPGS